MAALSNVINVVFNGENRASAAIGQVEAGLAKVDEAGKSVSNVSSTMDSMAASLGRLGPLLLATFGIGSIAEFSRQFTEANVQLEKFTLAVTSIKGNGASVSQELEYLRATADRLGLSVKDTSNAYISLLAATKGTALEGTQTRVIFESIVSAMSLLGRSSAETEQALLAVQQMISKGNVSAEELRGQLGERLPGSFGIAAKAIGVTTAELGDMLKAGEVIADDFLPKFAAELNKTFGIDGQTRVESYTAALNRLGNSTQEAFQRVGTALGGLNGGLFKTLATDIDRLGISTEFLIKVGSALGNVFRGGSFDTFSAEVDLAAKSLQQLAAGTETGNQSLAETARIARQAAAAIAELSAEDQNEIDRLKSRANAQAAALNVVAEAYATLGIKPEKIKANIKANIDDVIAAFGTLSQASDINGASILKGLDAALQRIVGSDGIQTLRDSLVKARLEGKLTIEEFISGLNKLTKEQGSLDVSANKNAESLKKTEDAARRAQEAHERLQLELVKLASNERIKLIEAKVQLNVAQVQADTERIKAAFTSIDNTVNSTADVINKAFGALTGADVSDSNTRNALFRQLDIENANRQTALRLQSELTQAQIKVLEAQARQMDAGNPLIQVDGTGLKPHLEAFMWEILKAIQVRTNRDGLRLLLGV